MLVLPKCRREHEICFWSEIIWILEVKLKENVISSFSSRQCYKNLMPRRSIPWEFICYMQKKKKQSRSLLKPFTQLYRLNALNKYHVNQSSVFVFALRRSQVGSAVWRRLHLGTLASHSQRNCNNRRKCLCVFFNVIHNWRRDMQLRCLKMKKLNIKCVVEHIYLKLHHRNLWIQFVLVFFSPSKWYHDFVKGISP